MNEKIYIILPIHNRREVTRRFIACLKAQTFRNWHLVLIDDGSTDGTSEMVQAEIEFSTVLTGTGNWWWAGSLQQGFLWLKTHNALSDDIVLIINDDTEFESDYLYNGITVLRDSPKSMLVSNCYSLDSKELVDTGAYKLNWRNLSVSQTNNAEEANCLSTRGLFVRVEDFIDNGYFHPILLPHYLSDLEYTMRAYKKGIKLMTDASVHIHINELTTGYHCFSTASAISSIKKYFSKKSAANPFYWTSFILMACPWQYLVLNIARIWLGAFSFFVKSIARSLTQGLA